MVPGQATPAPEPGAPAPSTRAWSNEPLRSLVPSLVEVTPAGPVQRTPLTLPEYWIGRDAQNCSIARPADVLINARHARLFRDDKGQWHIENNKSLNGLWLRVVEPHGTREGLPVPAGRTTIHFPGQVNEAPPVDRGLTGQRRYV